jgi:WD40 repeat protein
MPPGLEANSTPLHSCRADLTAVQGALKRSAQVLAGEPTQLAAQLLGRLRNHKGSEIRRLLDAAALYRGAPWLRPRTACLEPPGGPLLLTLSGHNTPISALAIAQDGSQAVSGDFDGILKVWDLDRGTETRALVGHETAIDSLFISPDGRRAISASRDGTVRVWDLDEGSELFVFSGYEGPLAIGADGSWALVVSSGNKLVFGDLNRGVETRRDSVRVKGCRVLTLMPDGRTATTLKFKEYTVHDLDRSETVRTVPLPPLSFDPASPDGRFAFAGDGKVTILDLQQGGDPQIVLTGHEWGVNSVAVTSDGLHAVSGSADKTVRVWDLWNGRPLAVLAHPEQVRVVSMTPDVRLVLSGTQDGTVRLWDLDRVGPGKTAQVAEPAGSVAVLPRGRLAVSSAGTLLKVRDIDSDEELHALEGHTDKVTGIAITADCRSIVSGASDGTIRVWDMDKEGETHCLSGHAGWVKVAAHPNGSIVSASEDGSLGVWDLERQQRVCTRDDHQGSLFALALTPNGQRAITGRAIRDESMTVWDLSPLPDPPITLKERTSARGKLKRLSIVPNVGSFGRTGIISLCTTLDGQRVVAGAASGEIRVWDLTSQEVRCRLRGHEDRVTALAAMADGERIVSASPDHTIRVWNVNTGDSLLTFTGDSGFTDCVVTCEADIVVAGDSNGRVHVFDVIEPAPGWIPPRRRSVRVSGKPQRVFDTSMKASDRFYEVLASAALKGIPVLGQLGALAGAIYGWRAGGALNAIMYGFGVAIAGMVAASLLAVACWLIVGIPLKWWDKSKGRRWSRVR